MTLDTEDADDLHGHVPDADPGADRVLEFAEEVRGGGLAEEAHRAALGLVFRRQRAPGDDGPVPDLEVARRDAEDARGPVLIAVDRLRALPVDVGEVRDGGVLFEDRRAVGHPQRRSAPDPRADAVGARRPGKNDEHVRAEALELGLERRTGAFADREHRDQGRDPDEDAEHRQRRAHLVAADPAQCRDQRHRQERPRLRERRGGGRKGPGLESEPRARARPAPPCARRR